MRRLPSASSAAMPYALPLTKTCLQTMQSLNSLIHAPCVAPVIGVALQAITILEVGRPSPIVGKALAEWVGVHHYRL